MKHISLFGTPRGTCHHLQHCEHVCRRSELSGHQQPGAACRIPAVSSGWFNSKSQYVEATLLACVKHKKRKILHNSVDNE